MYFSYKYNISHKYSTDKLFKLLFDTKWGNNEAKLEFTIAAQNVCGDASQLLSEESHVGLGDINALQHADWRLSLLGFKGEDLFTIISIKSRWYFNITGYYSLMLWDGLAGLKVCFSYPVCKQLTFSLQM